MKWSHPRIWAAIAIGVFCVIITIAILSFEDGKFSTFLDQTSVGQKVESSLALSSDRSFNHAEMISEIRVDSTRLWNTLTALSGERYQWAARENTRTYLTQTLEAAGWVTHQQFFTRQEGNQTYSGINIIAENSVNSARNTCANEQKGHVDTLLVGAHYDTVQGSSGADDNGTGIAAILELAELLAPDQYSAPLKLVLFDLEEFGLWGSEAFVANFTEMQGVTHAIILEMLGYRCQVDGCQYYPPLPIPPPSTIGNFIAVIGDRGHPELTNTFLSSPHSDIPIYGLTVPTFGPLTPDLLRSDHVPFWRQGIGAVMVTDTANFRNPHYHQKSDRPNTLDPEFFTAAAQAVVNAVIQLVHPVKYNNLVTEPC